MGPPSDVSSEAQPPSTVGPSVSMITTASERRQLDFHVYHSERDPSTQEPKKSFGPIKISLADARGAGIGRGGFISPIRSVTEAAQGIPEATYDKTETPLTVLMTDLQSTEDASSARGHPRTPPETVPNQTVEDTWELEIVPVQVPTLNGGPPTSVGGTGNLPERTITTSATTSQTTEGVIAP